tara:strand:+ start:46 stop:432 length:387 start_codon:yes stop_codon:yes gene_type:complete
MAFKMAGWSPFNLYDKFDILKGKEHLNKIKKSSSTNKTKKTTTTPTKTTKTKLPPPKGRIGSDYRKKEYDKRNWKYDHTINTGKKKATKKVKKKDTGYVPQTRSRKSMSTDYDPSSRNKYNYTPQSRR